MGSYRNMSENERLIRVLIGGALALFASYGPIGIVLLVVFGAISAILMLTGLVGYCPAYSLMKAKAN